MLRLRLQKLRCGLMTDLLGYTDSSLRLVDLLCRDVMLFQKRCESIVIILRELQLCIRRDLCGASAFDRCLCRQDRGLRGGDIALGSAHACACGAHGRLFAGDTAALV